jgi:hypothetical protein
LIRRQENHAGKWDGCGEGAGVSMGLRSSAEPVSLPVLGIDHSRPYARADHSPNRLKHSAF